MIREGWLSSEMSLSPWGTCFSGLSALGAPAPLPRPSLLLEKAVLPRPGQVVGSQPLPPGLMRWASREPARGAADRPCRVSEQLLEAGVLPPAKSGSRSERGPRAPTEPDGSLDLGPQLSFKICDSTFQKNIHAK